MCWRGTKKVRVLYFCTLGPVLSWMMEHELGRGIVYWCLSDHCWLCAGYSGLHCQHVNVQTILGLIFSYTFIKLSNVYGVESKHMRIEAFGVLLGLHSSPSLSLTSMVLQEPDPNYATTQPRRCGYTMNMQTSHAEWWLLSSQWGRWVKGAFWWPVKQRGLSGSACHREWKSCSYTRQLF